MRHRNPDNDTLRRILTQAKTIAVVGCSPKPARSSHQIAAFLQQIGYRVIPVHPWAREIHGERVYARLLDIPASIHVDIVDVFRKPEACVEIARQTVAIGADILWLQQGIVNEQPFPI